MAPGIETAILQMAVGQIPMGKLPSTKKVEASPLPPTQYSNPAYRRRQAAGQEAPSRGGESPSLPLFQGPLVGRDTTSMFSSLEQQGAQSLVVLLDKSFQTGDAEPLRAFLINRARQLPVNGPTDKSREDAISRLENRDSKAILRDGVAELILLLNNTGSRDGAVFAFNLSYILRQLNSNCSDVAINDLRLKSAEEELAKFFAWPGLLKDGQILKAFQQSAYYDSMGQGTYNLFINEDSLKDSLKNAKKTAEFCAPRLSAINEAYYKSLSSSVRFFTQAYRDHLEGKDELAIERLKTSLVYLDSDNVLSFKMLDSEREMQYQRKQLEQSLAEGQLSVDRSVANINIVDQVAPNLGAVSALFAGYRLPWMLLYVAALRAFKQGVNAFSREHNFGVPHAEAWSDARQRFIEQYSRDVVDLTAARLTRSFLSFSAAPGPESAGGLLFRSGRSLGGLWPARTQISNLERVVPGVAETLAARRATFGGVAFNLFSAPPHAAIDHLSGNRRFNAGSFLMVDLLLGSGIAGFSSKLSGINATRQTNLYSWAIKEGSPTRTLAFWSYYILTETAEWFADIFGSGVAATIRKNTASPAYDSTNPDTYPAMFGLNSDEMAQVVFQSAVRRSISSQVAISSMVAHGQARAFRDFAEAELQQRARQLQQDLKGGGPDWSVNIALAKEVDSASPSSNQARLSWPEHIFGPKRGSFALTQSDNNFPNFWAREARLRLARTPEERQNLLLQWGAAPTFGERFANLLLPRPSLDLAAIHKLGLVSGRAVEHQVVDATLKRFGAPQDKAGMGPLTEQVKTRVESLQEVLPNDGFSATTGSLINILGSWSKRLPIELGQKMAGVSFVGAVSEMVKRGRASCSHSSDNEHFLHDADSFLADTRKVRTLYSSEVAPDPKRVSPPGINAGAAKLPKGVPTLLGSLYDVVELVPGWVTSAVGGLVKGGADIKQAAVHSLQPRYLGHLGQKIMDPKTSYRDAVATDLTYGRATRMEDGAKILCDITEAQALRNRGHEQIELLNQMIKRQGGEDSTAAVGFVGKRAQIQQRVAALDERINVLETMLQSWTGGHLVRIPILNYMATTYRRRLVSDPQLRDCLAKAYQAGQEFNPVAMLKTFELNLLNIAKSDKPESVDEFIGQLVALRRGDADADSIRKIEETVRTAIEAELVSNTTNQPLLDKLAVFSAPTPKPDAASLPQEPLVVASPAPIRVSNTLDNVSAEAHLLKLARNDRPEAVQEFVDGVNAFRRSLTVDPADPKTVSPDYYKVVATVRKGIEQDIATKTGPELDLARQKLTALKLASLGDNVTLFSSYNKWALAELQSRLKAEPAVKQGKPNQQWLDNLMTYFDYAPAKDRNKFFQDLITAGDPNKKAAAEALLNIDSDIQMRPLTLSADDLKSGKTAIDLFVDVINRARNVSFGGEQINLLGDLRARVLFESWRTGAELLAGGDPAAVAEYMVKIKGRGFGSEVEDLVKPIEKIQEKKKILASDPKAKKELKKLELNEKEAKKPLKDYIAKKLIPAYSNLVPKTYYGDPAAVPARAAFLPFTQDPTYRKFVQQLFDNSISPTSRQYGLSIFSVRPEGTAALTFSIPRGLPNLGITPRTIPPGSEAAVILP